MLRSIAVAAGLLLALVAACASLTAAAFGRAPLADRILVAAAKHLQDYRLDDATIFAHGKELHATCAQRPRTATLVVGRRLRLRERGRHLLGRTTLAELTDFELAGCPGALRFRLLRDLAHHADLVATTRLGGYELWLPHAHPALAVYFTRRDVPYELKLEGRTMRGTSHVRFGVRV
ncbi:MAG TPA: hypothetical protein VFB25_06825 [Gaiellaceae bacterium]|nr:hypothetical protein [Gaiellaceae bacterium]